MAKMPSGPHTSGFAPIPKPPPEYDAGSSRIRVRAENLEIAKRR
jgi:hypothetical protein